MKSELSSARLSAYAFCEPTCAGPCAPWCIRPLTAAGKKLGGGVDTPSLCGRVQPADTGGFGGWDVEPAVGEGWLGPDAAGRSIACRKCVAKLREVIGQ